MSSSEEETKKVKAEMEDEEIQAIDFGNKTKKGKKKKKKKGGDGAAAGKFDKPKEKIEQEGKFSHKNTEIVWR